MTSVITPMILAAAGCAGLRQGGVDGLFTAKASPMVLLSTIDFAPIVKNQLENYFCRVARPGLDEL